MALIESYTNPTELEHVIKRLSEIEISDDLESARNNLDNLGSKLAGDIHAYRFMISDIHCQLLTPPSVDSSKIILYLHGGGYFCGSIISHEAMVGEIARSADCCALQLEYRKAPEHHFPAPVEDSCMAYKWLLNKYKPEDIIIAGDSAGGGLTIATLLALKQDKQPLPAAAVCISPWVDMLSTGESHITRKHLDPIVTMDTIDLVLDIYMQKQNPRNPLASPLYGDLTSLPPILVQVGQREILYSDAEMLAGKAKKDGVDVCFEEWSDMVHVWHMFFNELQVAQHAIDRIGQFIREKTQ